MLPGPKFTVSFHSATEFCCACLFKPIVLNIKVPKNGRIITTKNCPVALKAEKSKLPANLLSAHNIVSCENSEMVQPVKVLATKPDDPGVKLGTHRVEKKKNGFQKVVL